MNNPFTNISIKPLETKEIDGFGQLQFENLERISAGRGDNSMNFDVDGLWMGNQFFDLAPFRVDLDGKIRATGVEISGAITAGTGSDIDWSYIGNVIIDWAVIEDAVINNLVVTNEMIADTITGKTIQTASSGLRIKITSDPQNTILMMKDNTIIGGFSVTEAGDNRHLMIASEGGSLDIQYGIGASPGYGASLNSSSNAISVGGAHNMGSAMLSMNTGDSYFGISWWGNNYSGTRAIVTNLRVQSNWLPHSSGAYSLGSTSYRWDWGYFDDVRIYGNLRVGGATDVEASLNTLVDAVSILGNAVNYILDNCCD